MTRHAGKLYVNIICVFAALCKAPKHLGEQDTLCAKKHGHTSLASANTGLVVAVIVFRVGMQGQSVDQVEP